MLKIRRPLGRLIFNMGIAIPGKTVFLIETAPWLSDRLRFIVGIVAVVRRDLYIATASGKYPDSKVHGANMGSNWGRQDPGGPHVGPMNLAIWVLLAYGICAYVLRQ